MSAVKEPIVVRVPYSEKVRSEIEALDSRLSTKKLRYLLDYPTVYIIHRDKNADRPNRRTQGKVYVGETGSIEQRTIQHINDADESTDNAWTFFKDESTEMFVIAHEHFNKSLTLDIENRFISYVLASDSDVSLGIVNGRTNPQNDYYTHEEFETIASKAWLKLNRLDERLFPPERVIQNSAIFKASPFHKLSDEQLLAEERVLDCLEKAKTLGVGEKHLILVEGMAGTGKTVLLSHLFLEIIKDYSRESTDDEVVMESSENFPVALVVNHDEQLTVYNAIMKRLGLQRRNNQIVHKATQFINAYSEPPEKYRHISGREHQLHPSKELDVVLIDEAHLLFTQSDQSYTGHGNQLWDILERSKVVVAVFDRDQVLRKSQELSADISEALFPPTGAIGTGDEEGIPRSTKVFNRTLLVSNIRLENQMRIDAGEEIIEWIDGFASGKGIGRIPTDTKKRSKDEGPYEIRVFESPTELFSAIQKKDESHNKGLSRVIATYDWQYKNYHHPNDDPEEYWAVSLKKNKDGEWVALDATVNRGDLVKARGGGRGAKYFALPWNLQLDSSVADESNSALVDRDSAWAERPETIYEAGSIYTIQGFDLNYAGVIIGPSVSYRDGRITFDSEKSCNNQATNGSANPEENLRHELNVLLKRGVHGLYLFAADKALQDHLLAMQEG